MKNRVVNRLFAAITLVAAVILMFICIGADLKDRYDYKSNPTGISLCINEVLYANLSEVKDEDGDRSDWIEIYNYGSDRVNLEGMSLADHRGAGGRWYFPESYIEAGDYLIVWASGKDKVTETGELHTDFMINGSETITLYDENKECIDEFYFKGKADTGMSVGRLDKNPEKLAVLSANTPGKANHAQAVSLVEQLDSDLGTPAFSAEAGIYDSEFELTISAGEGETILYTLDGSEPGMDSFVYSEPIRIKDRSGEPNTIGNIKTTIDYEIKCSWENTNTYKGTVVRARVMKDGVMSDKVATASYFIAPGTTFNIVSLSADPEDLFDKWDGIYVPGRTYYTWKKYNKEKVMTFPPANFAGDERIKGHIEIFSNDGNSLADNNVEVKLMGGASRYRPAKPLKISIDEDSETFDAGMFELLPSQAPAEEGMDKIVLRQAGTDFNRLMFTDIMAHDLVSGSMDVTTLGAQQAVLFINGEYWGIHNIREAYDADYFYRHFGVEEKNLSLIELNTGMQPAPEISVGSRQDLQEYLDLVEYVEAHDLSIKENYDYVCSKVDIDSYIDYYIAEMYFANDDWPGNNYRIWRGNQPGTEYGDGKWRPVFFDLDNAFRYTDFNSIEYVLTKDYDREILKDAGLHYNDNREIIEALMGNEEFSGRFYERFEECLNTVFSSENVLAEIDRFEALYAPEMDSQFSRWHTRDGLINSIKVRIRNTVSERDIYTVAQWEKKLENMRDFAKRRPEVLRAYIKEHSLHP